jgi:hypothetical protein
MPVADREQRCALVRGDVQERIESGIMYLPELNPAQLSAGPVEPATGHGNSNDPSVSQYPCIRLVQHWERASAEFTHLDEFTSGLAMQMKARQKLSRHALLSIELSRRLGFLLFAVGIIVETLALGEKSNSTNSSSSASTSAPAKPSSSLSAVAGQSVQKLEALRQKLKLNPLPTPGIEDSDEESDEEDNTSPISAIGPSPDPSARAQPNSNSSPVSNSSSQPALVSGPEVVVRSCCTRIGCGKPETPDHPLLVCGYWYG